MTLVIGKDGHIVVGALIITLCAIAVSSEVVRRANVMTKRTLTLEGHRARGKFSCKATRTTIACMTAMFQVGGISEFMVTRHYITTNAFAVSGSRVFKKTYTVATLTASFVMMGCGRTMINTVNEFVRASRTTNGTIAIIIIRMLTGSR
jgi:hypothetical protein